MSLPFVVLVRPMLTMGGIGEKDGKVMVLVADHSTPEEAAETLWHEMVHLLRSAGNFSQDEDEVTAAAQKLAAACPEVVDWCGIRDKLKT